MKSVAKQRGWRERNHRDLYIVIRSIATETGQPEFRQLFQVASELHSNFYEDRIPPDIVQESIDDVRSLIEKLELLPPGEEPDE